MAFDEDDVEITELDAPGPTPGHFVWKRPPFLTRRYRRPVTIISVGIVLLAIALLVASPVSSLLQNARGITPAQQVTAASQTLVVEPIPAWGTLLVDGHPAHLSAIQSTFYITLSPGQHVLTWRAVPFLDQRCEITVPIESGIDTCMQPQFADQAGKAPLNSPNQPGTSSIITFHESLASLPPVQATALIQATQDAINAYQSTAVVLPGEDYATPSLASSCTISQGMPLCYQTARQQLQAMLSFQLDAGISQNTPCISGVCIVAGEDCRLFCDNAAVEIPIATSSPSQWNTFAIISTFWHYQTTQGQPILPNETDSFLQSFPNVHLIPLTISWNGTSWHVIVELDNAKVALENPICDAAAQDIVQILYTEPHSPFSFQTFPAPVLSQGCLVKVDQFAGPSTPTPSTQSPPAYLLHYFGVLLAANAQAHHLWPYLPVATKDEMRMATEVEINAGAGT